AVDVRLGGEVEDDLHALHELVDERGVADVALHEDVPPLVGEVLEVLQVSGVGEQVEVHHLGARPGAEEVAHEVGADEAGPARNEALHGAPAPSKRPARIGLSRSCATSVAARWSEGTVPASVHHPRTKWWRMAPART